MASYITEEEKVVNAVRINIKPMTVNQCWRGGKRFKTDQYKAYIDDVLLQLRPREIPEGRLNLTIEAGFSNKGADLDNIAKPFIDILQKKYGFNDNRIYKLTLIKEIVKKGEEYIAFQILGEIGVYK